MSWLNLYAPAPTVEGLWDQCTFTTQAAQGPHEDRTLTQLPILCRQKLEGSRFSRMMAGMAELARTRNDPKNLRHDAESPPAHDGPIPDTDQGWYRLSAEEIPVFDDPNYQDSWFKDPDIRNHPDWHPAASPPHLTSAPPSKGHTGPEANGTDPAWPPMPQVTHVLLVPRYPMLGATNEPVRMEGYGPFSMEIAVNPMSESSSIYRILVDPITNQPLDSAAQHYRVTQAMRTMLRIRAEYCQFPGSNARACSSDVDHIMRFVSGGRTIVGNLYSLMPTPPPPQALQGQDDS